MNSNQSIETTNESELDRITSSSESASRIWAATDRQTRAAALEAIANALDADADALVLIAGQETNLTEARLRSELKRTSFQLRLFAEVLHEGSYLDVRIDHADSDWPMGAPRPDLRRILQPLGPVLVFAASNFPFAFSVAGGDTASALAAGCSVIVKAHSGHPALSAKVSGLVQDALARAGAPSGIFQTIFGTESGRAVLTDSRIKAGSFTGSIQGGRALFDLAQSRPEPIPFYGELGSSNPVFVTQAAAENRSEQIVAEFIASFTLGAGQFCTKPGILLVPDSSDIPELLAQSTLPPAARLLNDRIHEGYLASLADVSSATEWLNASTERHAEPPAPSLLVTSVDAVLANVKDLTAEVFGPAALVVRYRHEAQLIELAELLEGQLTATIMGEPADSVVPPLLSVLSRKAGRVLWNQWPTGVSVSYAQQHGGPYPATTSVGSTSVGTAAIARFMRPIAYQGFPAQLLPEELRDEVQPAIPQRINGSFKADLGRMNQKSSAGK